MATNWRDADAKCPFYHKLDLRSTLCEGLDNGTIMIRFGSNRNRDRHFDALCARSWEGCPIAIILECKYEEGD